MDIKEQVEKVFRSIAGNAAQIEAFKKDPIAVVKKYLGASISEDLINKVIAGVKTKLAADKLSGAASALGSLFNKK